MLGRGLTKGFGVFFDSTRITSGQRFFQNLNQELSEKVIDLDQKPSVILFNVSAPIKKVISAKVRGQKIVLRIDGLYSDQLSPAFINTFNWPLRALFSIGLKYKQTHNFLAFWANFLSQNYGGFLRIFLADLLIYQSEFSKDIHRPYFPYKQFEIIVNGSSITFWNEGFTVNASDSEIKLITIYDDWKPAKRMHDIVAFVRWAQETKNIPIHLTILGYTGKVPLCVPHAQEIKNTIENAAYIRTLPRFTGFGDTFRDALLESDMYISFSYRDPCPNTVVESMAHGLPVVGIASGGIADIVGNAGELLPTDDFANGFFSSHRFDCDFPSIDFEQVLDLVKRVKDNNLMYRERVKQRFIDELSIKVIASKYRRAM
ncbi:MAG: glycosyltransferase family 4 protein, partial [Pedobacter sp.]|nr:glycosyltransferase family 4 protein [Pedobacter sp.]